MDPNQPFSQSSQSPQASQPEPQPATAAYDEQYWNELEQVRFHDLGGRMHGNGDVHPDAPKPRPSLHFKLIKEWYTKDHSMFAYIGWGIAALFIGIAIASFITQAVLLARDVITNGTAPQTPAPKLATKTPRANLAVHTDESEPRGSDDAFSTSTPSQNQYKLANEDKFPKLSAKAFLVGDVETGEIIYESNPGYISPIASVSKLMTALIAHEKMDPNTVAIVSRDSYNTYGAQGGLLLGEKIKLVDLMYPLLIESSNDGAEVIAEAYPGGHAKFLEEMNKKAAALGMDDTYYEDPSGLSPHNVSSIENLFTLGRYIYKTAPQLYDMTRVKQFAILGHTWANQNRLLLEKTFIGGKNGYIDESLQTTVSIFNIPLAKGGTKPIMIVILKSVDRTTDAQKIITFMKKNAYFTPEVNEKIDVNAIPNPTATTTE